MSTHSQKLTARQAGGRVLASVALGGNAYLADLGAGDLSDAKALIVHYADGTTAVVTNDLRAPGS